MPEPKDLVQIIRDNPGAIARIDNDNWRLYKALPANFNEWDDDTSEQWWENNMLARSRDKFLPMGDFDGACYGGDILQALAVIVGIKIESV